MHILYMYDAVQTHVAETLNEKRHFKQFAFFLQIINQKGTWAMHCQSNRKHCLHLHHVSRCL